jgi:hypothetical protein
MRAVIATLIYALLAISLGAQDTTSIKQSLAKIKVREDSLFKEACRNGTVTASGGCSGSAGTPRVTYVRRHTQAIRAERLRIDSLLRKSPIAGACTPATCPMYATRYYTNSENQWFASEAISFVDTVTLCAVLEGPAPSTTKRLVWPPVRFRYYGDNDSVTFTLRSGNPLMQMCARAAQAEGITSADSLTAPKVVWKGEWFDYRGRRLWRPLASLPPN